MVGYFGNRRPAAVPGRCIAALLAMLALPAGAFQIIQLSPQGEVAQVRQVVAKFDEPATRFGDAKAADPLVVRCDDAVASQGSGRWNNEREWVFEFRRDLPPGVRCTAEARSPLASVANQPLRGTTRFAFNTGGPFVSRVHPGYGPIDEDQFFVLQLNGPAALATVQPNTWCTSDAVGERIPTRLIDGKPREAVLALRNLAKAAAREPLRYVTLACNRSLSPSAKVQLVWGAGVATPSGVANTVEKRFDFAVREPFSATFSCERENAQAACLPIRPMQLSFNAPIARSAAQAIRLRSGDRTWKPALSGESDEDGAKAAFVTGVRFDGLFPEQARFTLELPPSLRDDANRPLRNADNFPLQVATGAMPPLAKFAAAPFGIVERFAEPGTPPLLPVTLRNVEALLPASQLRIAGGDGTAAGAAAAKGSVSDLQPKTDADIIAWMRRVQFYDRFFVPRSAAARDVKDPLPPSVNESDRDAVQSRMVSLLKGRLHTRTLELPKPVSNDPRPFEVVGIPLTPGFHVLEIESARLGEALLDEKFGTPRRF
ncbi:MAG TPA: alpha-2-macroglobulin, partial [Burkholderiaceae bacterium]